MQCKVKFSLHGLNAKQGEPLRDIREQIERKMRLKKAEHPSPRALRKAREIKI